MDLIRRILSWFGYLPQPNIEPGPWFRSYVSAWAAAHNIKPSQVDDLITTGIVQGKNGWIYATDTPEWDRAWWESRGYAFPARWVPFSSLNFYEGNPGDYLYLDV